MLPVLYHFETDCQYIVWVFEPANDLNARVFVARKQLTLANVLVLKRFQVHYSIEFFVLILFRYIFFFNLLLRLLFKAIKDFADKIIVVHGC